MYKESTNKKKHASAAKSEAIIPKESLQLEDKRASSTVQKKVHTMMQNYTPKHVIQPKIIPYKTNYKGNLTEKFKAQVTSIASKLDQRVQQAYKQSLQWRSLEKNPDKFVKSWYKMAQTFAQSPHLKKEPKLMYARFGYSIEAIATAGLNNQNIGGLIAKTQVSHGHTRPDIVLIDPLSKSEIAWLDITSAASIGHIDGKDGAGWANRPFIFEIVYPKLQIQALLNATNDPYYKELGVLLSNEKQIELDTKLKNENQLRKQFISHRDKQNWKTGSHNATKKRQQTRDFFMSEAASEGVEEETNSMKNTRGALEYLGINPGPFGFNRGRVKPTNERIVHVIHEKSKKEIQKTQGQLYYATSDRILKELQNKIPKKLFDEFYEELHVLPNSKNLSLALMAMKGALTDFPKLDMARDTVKSFTDPNDNRAKKLEKELSTLLKGPQSISHMAIMNWRNTAQEKAKEGHQLSEIAKLQRSLFEYSKKKGWTIFKRPKQITKWFQELAASPLNIKAAKEVQTWLKNPTPLP